MVNSMSRNKYSIDLTWSKDVPRTKWLFTLFWVQYTVIYWSCVILNKLPFFIYVTPVVFPLLLCASIFVWLRATQYRIDIWNIILLMIALAFWYISRLRHPEYKVYFDENAHVCLGAFLMVYVGKSAFRGGIDKDYFAFLGNVSKIGVAMTALYFIYGVFTGRITAQEYMTISYRVLPSTLCLTAIFLRDLNLKNTVWFVFAVLLQLFMGTRGAVLAIAVFIVLYFFLFAKKKNFFIAIFCAGVFLLLDRLFDFINLIIIGISKICASFNMSTRIFDAILSSTLTNDNGREMIYTFVGDRIQENIWTGQGIFADRYIMSGFPGGGLYVHNIFLELWSNFGLIPSILILALLIFAFLRCVLNKYLPREAKLLVCISFSAAMTQLMFTGSYLTDAPFWLLIGLLWGASRYKTDLKKFVQ